MEKKSRMEKVCYLQVDFTPQYKTAYLLLLQSGHQVLKTKFSVEVFDFWLQALILIKKN